MQPQSLRGCSLSRSQQLIQQRIACRIDQPKDELEPIAAAIKRIGYFSKLAIGIRLQEQLQLVLRRAPAFEILSIGFVHANQMIEAIEVFGRDLASTTSKHDAVLFGNRSGSVIGALAGVPLTCSGGIDQESISYAALVQLVQKRSFSQRAAADIAHTYKENAGLGRCTHRRGTLIRLRIVLDDRCDVRRHAQGCGCGSASTLVGVTPILLRFGSRLQHGEMVLTPSGFDGEETDETEQDKRNRVNDAHAQVGPQNKRR